MSENNSTNSNKKKGARASIASMDYGGLNGASSFGMGKAARSLVSGPLANTEAKIVELNLIDSNPDQPRTYFDPTRLEELAEDIKERGILQPPVVRDMGNGRYQIVAGERRCRAARKAGLTEIPVIIKEFKNEQDVKLASLAENLQRDDLDIEDEIRFLKILQNEGLTLRQIADLIHRSHLYVYRRLEIAEEPELIKLYREGQAGIETLGKIAKIEDKKEREAAINALKLAKTETTKTQSKSGEKEEAVTLRNKILPVYKFMQTLSRLKVDQLKAEEKRDLRSAIEELEEVLAEIKRQVKA